MLAATLIIVALARPMLDAGALLPGNGPVLLVIDNGWAAAADWPRRMQAAGAALDRAERAGRQGGAARHRTERSRARRRRRARRCRSPSSARGSRPCSRSPGRRIVTPPPPRCAPGSSRARPSSTSPTAWSIARDFAAFAAALGDAGSVTELCCDGPPARVLLPPRAEADRLVARLEQTPAPAPTEAAVLAQSGDGRTLARATLTDPGRRDERRGGDRPSA